MSEIILYKGDCPIEMNKIACINTKRNFIGIEKDDKYFKISKDRIEKAKESLFDM